MKTDTPRTDDSENRVRKNGFSPLIGYCYEYDMAKLEIELAAVTEQRDELLRYNEAFRKETLICADCDSISKEEYDRAIERVDGLRSCIDYASDQLRTVTEQRDEIHKDFMCLAELLDGHDATECRMNLVRLKEQRDRLTKSIEPLKYWRDISECDCSNPLPQGGCLRCDLDRILNNQSKLIHNGGGIADMYSPGEFEIAMNRTNKS